MRKIILALMGLTLLTGTAFAATVEEMENSFNPYKNGFPTVEGIKPGMVIDANNWQVAEDVIDPAFLQYIQAGYYSIRIGESFSFDVNPNFIEQTKARLGKAKLGDKPGQISNADAGRPFVEEPSLDDPRAGEKLAWNFKYGHSQGDEWLIDPWFWKYNDMKSGKKERQLRFNFHFRKFNHRYLTDPTKPAWTPNPSNVFRSTFLTVEKPFDVKNTQVLVQRYEDDTKLDNSYIYLGFQRRVRRLSSGQTTDAFLGSDIMLEDFEGYNGRLSDMTWTYLGTKPMLVPMYKHNEEPTDDEVYTDDPDGYRMTKFIGTGNCFPDVSWQLRTVYVVESKPVDPNHPVGKRLHYMDVQTATIPLTNVYDRAGKLWRSFTIGYTHADFDVKENKGTDVVMYNFFSMVDPQVMHCTTGQFKTVTSSPSTTPNVFTVQHMRAVGR
ncbi:MAG: DUF1329 domain-containing protein [Deltaproteobacteria bacterium]|nr:MAG: DUF1329 domain-containing protein [Deltaproteobacteria bacterium]